MLLSSYCASAPLVRAILSDSQRGIIVILVVVSHLSQSASTLPSKLYRCYYVIRDTLQYTTSYLHLPNVAFAISIPLYSLAT